jgi:hypothetical protein
MFGFLSIVWTVVNITVQVVSFVLTVLLICGAIGTVVAALSGVLLPLWRLGLGLARRNITIIASSDDANSLQNLLKQSRLFSRKKIHLISLRDDIEDIELASVILFKYSGSPFTLREVIERKSRNTPIVVFAKPNEITNPDEWKLMDEVRHISVCNLKGRLLNDLLTLMMTSGYERK